MKTTPALRKFIEAKDEFYRAWGKAGRPACYGPADYSADLKRDPDPELSALFRTREEARAALSRERRRVGFSRPRNDGFWSTVDVRVDGYTVGELYTSKGSPWSACKTLQKSLGRILLHPEGKDVRYLSDAKDIIREFVTGADQDASGHGRGEPWQPAPEPGPQRSRAGC